MCPTFTFSKLGQASSSLGDYHTVWESHWSLCNWCLFFITRFLFGSFEGLSFCGSFSFWSCWYHLCHLSNYKHRVIFEQEYSVSLLFFFLFLKCEAALCGMLLSWVPRCVWPGTSRHCWITAHFKKGSWCNSVTPWTAHTHSLSSGELGQRPWSQG